MSNGFWLVHEVLDDDILLAPEGHCSSSVSIERGGGEERGIQLVCNLTSKSY